MGLDQDIVEALAQGDDVDDYEFFSFVGMNRANFDRVYWAAVEFGVSREDLVAECMTYYRGSRSSDNYRFLCDRRPIMRAMWPRVGSTLLTDAQENEHYFRTKSGMIGKIAEVGFRKFGKFTIMVAVGPHNKVYHQQTFKHYRGKNQPEMSKKEMFEESDFLKNVLETMPIFKAIVNGEEVLIPGYVTMNPDAVCTDLTEHNRVLLPALYHQAENNKTYTTLYQKLVCKGSLNQQGHVWRFWGKLCKKIIGPEYFSKDDLENMTYYVSATLDVPSPPEIPGERLECLSPDRQHSTLNARQQRYDILRRQGIANRKIIGYTNKSPATVEVSLSYLGFLEGEDVIEVHEKHVNMQQYARTS